MLFRWTGACETVTSTAVHRSFRLEAALGDFNEVLRLKWGPPVGGKRRETGRCKRLKTIEHTEGFQWFKPEELCVRHLEVQA